MDFTEAPLSEVVDFLKRVSGIKMVIEPEVYEELSEETLRVELMVVKLKLHDILELMLVTKGLSYSLKNGVVVIGLLK